MNVIKACWVKAKPIAVPTNGAVQGVASSVTKNPSRKLPSKPSNCINAELFRDTKPDKRNSKNPNKFPAKTVKITINMIKNVGC